MNEIAFKVLISLCALIFFGFFCAVVVPPLFENPDVVGAFAAGFVNPYSSGYSFDVIMCWCILAIWVIFEAKQHAIKGGWVCLILGTVPGVAVGFAAYLLLRARKLSL